MYRQINDINDLLALTYHVQKKARVCVQGSAKKIQEDKEVKEKSRDWERYVAHKKATSSALKAVLWDHLNGILQTSLEEKNTKPFYLRHQGTKKNTIILVFPLKNLMD